MIALLFLVSVLAQPVPPSAEQFYGEALHNTRQLVQPANALYVVDVHVDNARYESKREPNGRAMAAFEVGDNSGKVDDSFPAAYRDSDRLTAIQTQDKRWGSITSPFLNPTWAGISDWIQYGEDGRPLDAPNASNKSGAATPVPANAPKTIFAVTAMGVAYYNVADVGARTCANGDPGHAVHLMAREDPKAHPLTDATIDLRTHRICEVRFGFKQAGPLSANGLVDADLAERDGVLLVTREHLEFNIHVFGIQLKHVGAELSYRDISFPQTLDQAMFK